MGWTEQEGMDLQKYIQEGKTVSQIMELMKKSYTAIRKKVKRFGLNVNITSHQWTVEEDDRLREEYAIAANIADLATTLGVTVSQLKRRVSVLGLRRIRKPSKNFHGTRAGALKREQNKNLKVAKSLWMKKIWQDDGFRKARALDARKAMTADKKQKMLAGFNKARLTPEYNQKIRVAQKNGSSIERIVWRLLDSFGLKEGTDWFKHSSIGYYQVDIEVKRPGRKSLLIECQGDYWHTLERVIRTDKAKKTYIETYFADTHELVYLWEHEFLMEGKICAKLKRWIFGVAYQVKDFEFSSLEVREATRAAVSQLVEDYHYLSRIGRGGYYIGCFLNDCLIAATVFSGATRQTTPKSLGYQNSEVLELSRFVIHPEYQKPNLGSWFLSRAINVLQKITPKVKCLVSFSDENQGHSGALYKAAGWVQSGVVVPDYWYVDKDGFVTSKKKAYMMARKMKQTERVFTEQKEWKKVYGFGKLRFTKVL